MKTIKELLNTGELFAFDDFSRPFQTGGFYLIGKHSKPPRHTQSKFVGKRRGFSQNKVKTNSKVS